MSMQQTETNSINSHLVEDGRVSILGWLWQSIGTELMIFFITMAFALAFRGSKMAVGRNVAIDKKNRKDKITSLGDKSQSGTPKNNSDWTELQSVVQGFAQGSGGNTAAQWPQSRQRNLAQIINDVVDGMQSRPSAGFSNQALDQYGELRRSLREDKTLTISDITRRSKHSAADFYSTMVQCAVRANMAHLVDIIIADMIEQSVQRSHVFYESTMKQLAGQKQYNLALAMYDRMEADRLEPSSITLSCLVNFAAEVGETERANTFFEKLCSLSTPSIRACMTVLRMHAKSQDWSASSAVFQIMRKTGVQLDSLSLNIVLATGVAANQLNAVEELLAETESLGVPVDVVSFNTIIKGYAHRNDMNGATRVFERLESRGLRANAITFNTLMDAAVRSSQFDEAWSLLSKMRDARLTPDKFSASILIKGLSQRAREATVKDSAELSKLAGHARAAAELLGEIFKKLDATFAASMYNAIFDAAMQFQDDALAMHIFAQMRQNRVVPSDAAMRHSVHLMRTSGPRATPMPFAGDLCGARSATSWTAPWGDECQ